MDKIKKIIKNTNLTPEQKYFEIYLGLSEEEKSIGQMASETGYSESTIRILLKRKALKEKK